MVRLNPIRALFAFALLAPLSLAGCAGSKSFDVAVATWEPGQAWEYGVEETSLERVTGRVPSFLEDEIEAQDRRCTDTERIEVFNTTVIATDDTPLYATGRFVAPGGDGERSCSGSQGWSSRFYTRKDLNPVDTQRVEFSQGDVTLEEGQPEEQRHRFPLRNGLSWSAPVSEDEELGEIRYRVVRQESHASPGGKFESVRIQARYEPPNQEDIERQVRAFFASQDARLDKFDFSISIQSVYWYASEVRNDIESQDIESAVISASGKEEGGDSFDFTYESRETRSLRLLKYQLERGPERPLAFLGSQLSGYRPPPITPLAHHVAEIVVSRDGLNAGTDEDSSVEFRLRVFNTTAGEERLRSDESRTPVVAPAKGGDPRLVANWTFQRESEDGLTQLGAVRTGDVVSLRAFELGGPGRIYASVTLKDVQENVVISTDEVEFDVYWRRNITLTVTPDNASQGEVASVFPVGFGATRIDVAVSFSDSTPHQLGRVRIEDAQGNNVDGRRMGSRGFSATELEPYTPGSWRISYNELTMVPQSTYTLDTWVSYRIAVREE